MITVHEIQFVLHTFRAIDALIEEHTTDFAAEFVAPEYAKGGMRTLIRADRRFVNADAALQWISEEISRYAETHNTNIIWIKNPCGSPFVKIDRQTEIFRAAGIFAAVLEGAGYA